MYTQSSIPAAYPLAGVVTRNGKVLDTAPDSALADLMAVCPVQVPYEVDEGTSPDEVVAVETLVAEGAEVESIPGVNDHDVEMNRVVELAAKACAYTLDMARNIVAPQIRTVVEKTEQYIDSNRAKKLAPLVIEAQFVAPVYQAAEFGDLIGKYAGQPNREIAPQRLTAQWSGEGGGVLATGIPSFDGLVAKHFVGREEQARDLWEKFYSNVPGKFREANLIEAMPGTDDALVAFLGAHSLLEGEVVPEGLSMDLPSYRSYLSGVKEQAGVRLNYLHGQANTRVKSKQLVISAPRARAGLPVTGTVVVCGEVYNQWLAEGGSPEALFGAIKAGATLQYDVLLAGAAEFAADWTRAMALLEQQSQFELQAVTVQGMRNALVDLLREIPEDQLAASPEEMISRINERLTHFHLKDVNEIYATARKAVCRVFYPHTDAEKILNAMEAVCEAKPDLEPREAALLVLMDYVVDWVASGIVVADAGE